jgi:glucose/arabinose dehydrogenase
MKHLLRWCRNSLVWAGILFAGQGIGQTLEPVFRDKGVIWSLAFVPDGRILYTLRSGELKVFDPQTKRQQVVTGTPPVAVMGQGGLLEVALSPHFAETRQIYLTYAKQLGSRATTALGRAVWDGNRLSRWEELFVALPGTDEDVHFAGKLLVEKEAIFLTVGDRGERELAQKLDSHMGKVLRLTLEGKAHPENPFMRTKGALPEIYSYGHRNPQGMARHPGTGELWVHEHGPKGGDELNLVKMGKNYGWPVITFGREYYGLKIGEGTHKEGMEQPAHVYIPSIAPSGLVIYQGKRYPTWHHHFLLGSLVLTHLNLVSLKDGKLLKEERLFGEKGLRVRDVRQSPDDWVYIATDQGLVYRIRDR